MATDWLTSQSNEFEETFRDHLSSIKCPEGLKEAMLYSSLNGGKRLRPLLVIAAGHLSNANSKTIFSIASAIECIHAYSLIHDDLPAMDNDSLRRGQPTCHIQFDEATAILAGDALLSEAFVILSNLENLSAETILKLIRLIATSAGAIGMVGGQYIDLESENKQISHTELKNIHRLKTGALIKASILAGIISGNYNEDLYQTLALFADKIGLAFQVKDDILDETQSSEILGKTAGKDFEQDKATYTSILGLEEAEKQLNQLVKEAMELLAPLAPHNQYLLNLAQYIVNRSH